MQPQRGMSGTIDGLFGTTSSKAAEEADARRAAEATEEAARREEEEQAIRRAEAAAAARKAATEEAERAARAEAAASSSAAAAASDVRWVVSAADKAKFDAIFSQMQPEDGVVGGAKVAPVLKKSGLAQDVLRDIWTLVDVHKDGVLDADWFALAMHLAMKTKRGHALPPALSPEHIPPKDR